jgi:hypothetical protein
VAVDPAAGLEAVVVNVTFPPARLKTTVVPAPLTLKGELTVKAVPATPQAWDPDPPSVTQPLAGLVVVRNVSVEKLMELAVNPLTKYPVALIDEIGAAEAATAIKAPAIATIVDLFIIFPSFPPLESPVVTVGPFDRMVSWGP